MDGNNDVIAAGQTNASDGQSKFTVVKLRREDGMDYSENPTPLVPETVKKHAPLVYLHSDDDYRPGNPASFINESSLNWFREGDCDPSVLAVRSSIVADRLGSLAAAPYTASPTWSALSASCIDTPDIVFKAHDYTRPWDDKPHQRKKYNNFWNDPFHQKEGFYLDFTDEFESQKGMPDPVINQPAAPVFYEYVPGKYVTYWFFYPYNLFRIENSVLGIPAQKHEGDWERISIQLDSNDNPVYVFFSQHHDGEFVLWSLVDKYEGTHPKVYSAKGSHGSFVSVGEFQTEFCRPFGGHCALDRTNDTGPKWSTWKNLNKAESQPWYGYGGAWGKVSTHPEVGPITIPNINFMGQELTGAEYTGPLGPSNFKNDGGKWDASINGYVKALNGSGLAGVRMKAVDSQGNTIEAIYCNNSTQVTCIDGRYSFNLVLGKNYTITPSKEGYNFDPAFLHFVNLRGNQDANNIIGRISDITPPVLSLPAAITVNATGPSGAIVNYTAMASDDRTVNPTIICNPSSGSVFSIGITTVTCTAADAAGNIANGNFKITVKSAAAQLTDLITVLNSSNLGQSLKNNLEKAQIYVNQGDTRKACSEMDKFIENVQKEKNKGKLSSEQARLLTEDATRIKSVIGCF